VTLNIAEATVRRNQLDAAIDVHGDAGGIAAITSKARMPD
jgi:hypothetical protein